MKIKLRHFSKEIKITLTIWGILSTMAIVAVFLLRHNSVGIIENLYSVNVGRGLKANVLYAEADKLGRILLNKAENLNKDTSVKVPISKHDQSLQRFESVMRPFILLL